MEEHPEPVQVTTARTPFEADIIVSILNGAGIPAYRPGGLLVDEFAMSQQMMNLQGVTVYVPANRLEEAREALAEADAQGQVDGDEPPTEENPTDAE